MYRIKCWIPIQSEDIENEEFYSSEEEARKDLESMELMQPENIYKIEEVE